MRYDEKLKVHRIVGKIKVHQTYVFNPESIGSEVYNLLSGF